MSTTNGLLSRVRSRLALAGFLEDLQRGLAAGALALLVLFALRALGWWSPALALTGLVAAATCLAVPLVGVFVRRFSRRGLAAEADTRLGLAERVSTSVWAAGPRAQPGPLGDLVIADAEAAAARVTPLAIRRAIRPRVQRRPLIAAGVALAGAAILFFVHPQVAVAETPGQKAARLADQNRIADVARRMAKAAKRVEEAAKDRKEIELERVATQIRAETQKMSNRPPVRQVALEKLNDLAELARAAARKRAGMSKPVKGSAEASKASKALAELLKQMSQAGIESLQKNLAELQKRLDAGEKGESPPSAEEMRAMANRLDALRRAMEQADALGMQEMRDLLASLGNEDLLEQIAQRMREIASKLDSAGYEGLESGEMGESFDLSELTREELEELLKQLDELAAMEDLARMLQQGGGESAGGRRLRLGGSGGT